MALFKAYSDDKTETEGIQNLIDARCMKNIFD